MCAGIPSVKKVIVTFDFDSHGRVLYVDRPHRTLEGQAFDKFRNQQKISRV